MGIICGRFFKSISMAGKEVVKNNRRSNTDGKNDQYECSQNFFYDVIFVQNIFLLRCCKCTSFLKSKHINIFVGYWKICAGINFSRLRRSKPNKNCQYEKINQIAAHYNLF